MKLSEYIKDDLPDQNPDQMADADQPQSNVTEQDQSEYEDFVYSAVAVITDSAEQIVQMLGGQQDNPAEALATTAFTIVTAMDEKAGGQIPPEILLHGSGEVIDNIGELAIKAGVFQVDEAIEGKSKQMLLSMLAEEYDVDEEAIAAELPNIDQTQLNSIIQQQEAYAQQ